MFCFLFLAAFFTLVTAPTPIFLGNSPVTLRGVPFSLKLRLQYSGEDLEQAAESTQIFAAVYSNGVCASNWTYPLLKNGQLQNTLTLQDLVLYEWGAHSLDVLVGLSPDLHGASLSQYDVWCVPGWVTLFPPAIVVITSLVARQVLLSLFLGIFAAACIIYKGNIMVALLRTIDLYVVNALANEDHVKVLLFTWVLAAMVAVMHKSGAAHGMASLLTSRITTRRGVQLVAILLGLVIFFDDYANSIILGATLRRAFDEHFVSREKFCFLVDCTAAPIASIAPVSSWIGFELSLIQEQIDVLKELGQGPALHAAGVTTAYPLFLQTIPGRFYSICMLTFVLAIAVSGRDFGPMLSAERRALFQHQPIPPNCVVRAVELERKLEPPDDVPRQWWNAVLPITATVATVLTGLLVTGWMAIQNSGEPASIATLLGSGDAYGSILWGACVGFTVLALLCCLQYRMDTTPSDPPAASLRPWKFCRRRQGRTPIMTFKETMAIGLEGAKGLTLSVITLVLAWAIGKAVQDVGCARYVASVLTAGVPPPALPALTFIAAATISLCIGTSWGTMAILFPAVVPAAWVASQDVQLWGLVISAILAGSVFGDHASIISDTTIISAMACDCDLRCHVVTQGAYCIVIASVALVVGYLGSGYLWPVWVGLLSCMVTTVLLVAVIAIKVDQADQPTDIVTRLCARLCGMRCKRRLPFIRLRREREGPDQPSPAAMSILGMDNEETMSQDM